MFLENGLDFRVQPVYGGKNMDSFIGWIGGKRILRGAIISRFPAVPPKRYIEVCGGAGWVFFRKERIPGQLEVFNDVNSQLINLYKCVKYHEPELQRWLQKIPYSRELFEDFKAETRGLTDIQRAARYFYIVKYSFGSNQRSFATGGYSFGKVMDRLSLISDRLNGVVLENRDFERIIRVYDRSEALFYIDPPYVGSEELYDNPFTPEDHDRLRDVLRGVKGKFILSYNDCPKVREMYAWAHVEAVTRKNQLPGKSSAKGDFGELIIRNYGD